MISTTLSDFRSDLKHYIDTVIDDYETIIINRGKDKAAVILSLDEFNSWEATLHEMSSKANMDRLHESIQQIKDGQVVYKTMEELNALE